MGQATGAVLLDLTASYDTVWLTGLHLKIQKAKSAEKLLISLRTFCITDLSSFLQVAKQESLIKLKIV